MILVCVEREVHTEKKTVNAKNKQKTERGMVMKRKIEMTITLSFMILVLTGCGMTKLDLNDYISYEVTGYDGYGTIQTTFDTDHFEKDAMSAQKDLEDLQQLSYMFALEAAFSYEWNQQDNLSNGDEIKLVWNIDNDSLEKYNLKLEASELSEKVEGLEEIESYDAFSEIEVNVSGISPNGTLSIDSSRAEVPLNYSADKTTGIKKGDVITIEAAAPDGGDLSQYCASYGMLPREDTYEYTVETMDSYAMSLADIPKETIDKMFAEAQDDLTAAFASRSIEDETLQEIEYLGAYFLSLKEDEKLYWGNQNEIYLVMKVTVSNSAITDQSYYTYAKFGNIVNLADGTCSVDYSAATYPSGSFWGGETVKFAGDNDHYYVGYDDLDTMFNHCVTQSIGSYNYESSVEAQ